MDLLFLVKQLGLLIVILFEIGAVLIIIAVIANGLKDMIEMLKRRR